MRYAGIFLCDRCLIRTVESRFRKTVAMHRLINPGDRIAVAVSGGKDSVSCMRLLAGYCSGKRCELVAITVDEGIKGYRSEGLRLAIKNARELGVEHFTVRFRDVLGSTLDAMVKKSAHKSGMNPCTLCGVIRRALLNRAAKKLDAQKLATAHNMDDEVQAIMLNYVRSDFSRLYRLGPKYEAKRGFVPRIKPLREIPEKEMALYAMLSGIEVHLGTCPYSGGLHSEIRDFLNSLEENHPNSKFMILRMFDRMKPFLSKAAGKADLGECEVCGEPTPSRLCKACSLSRELGLTSKDLIIRSSS
ncbi:MAG: TIGR00269 family protein [Candidatus Hadarchaeales archaeon]